MAKYISICQKIVPKNFELKLCGLELSPFVSARLHPGQLVRLIQQKDIVCAPYWLQPAEIAETGEWATRMVEFRWDILREEYVISDLQNPTESRYVSGWLPIGFSLINLKTIKTCCIDNWFGTNQSVQEDKTFALNAIKYSIRFYLFGEAVKHNVRTVI